MNDTLKQQDQGNDPGSETSRIKNTPGMRLRTLRNEKGLTQMQVADALHLTVHYVNALEQDEYQKLPGKIFVKGYFRTYAQLLGTNADAIIKSFEELCELREDYQIQKDNSLRKKKSHDHSRFWLVTAGILIIGAVFASWWFWGRGQQLQAAVPSIVPDYISAFESGLRQVNESLAVVSENKVQNQITADAVVLEVGEYASSLSPDNSRHTDSGGFADKENINVQSVPELPTFNTSDVPVEKQMNDPVRISEEVSENVPGSTLEIVREIELRQTVSSLEG
jgi:cytoskeletal protein RodZ